ncbi:MAG TPA: histone deacetylase [Chloroflexi bacterium]|nr:histone deacetylase [Chloroflexota bacterium]
MTTGYVFHPIYLEHNIPGHPERSERLQRIMQSLESSGTLARLTSVEATPLDLELLSTIHDPNYIKRVEMVAESGGGMLDLDTYVNAHSYEAALMAAGGLINAVEAVLSGQVDNVFALVRPPGHHALRDQGMGFCLFNNVALAAQCAIEKHGLSRILIADFDVHHGNGTQDAFYERDDVLYFSTHQYPHYPGTGHWREKGQGRGEGYTVNVPLPYGVGDEGYAQAFEEILLPLARRYHPELILVSAGYDAHWADPLAGMRLSTAGFHRLTTTLVSLAEELCQGRLVLTLEGGYDLGALSHSVLATFAALSREEAEDPLGPAPGRSPSIDDLLQNVKEVHHLT